MAFLLVLDSQLFASVLTRTVHNQRVLGALCFVSFLHLVFVFLIYRKPTPTRVVTTALQVALFTFVMFTRSSAVWMVIAFGLIGILIAFNQFDRPSTERTGRRALGVILSWPVILLAFGLGSSAIYKSSVLHPIYSVGIFLPHHMIWHSAYLGLILHPDWGTQGDRYDGRETPKAGDSIAWIGSVLEATERYGLPEAYLLAPEVGGLPTYKMGLHEKLVKERYLRFAAGASAVHAGAVPLVQAKNLRDGVRLDIW